MRLFAQYISRALTKLSSISIVWKLSLQRSQEKYCTGTMNVSPLNVRFSVETT
tara:strand:+ start:3792 stop:3950 length:159 start_codon:yes stop_codon:yes gene_type:complete